MAQSRGLNKKDASTELSVERQMLGLYRAPRRGGVASRTPLADMTGTRTGPPPWAVTIVVANRHGPNGGAASDVP